MAIGDNLTRRDQILIGVAVVALIAAGAYWYFPYTAKQGVEDAPLPGTVVEMTQHLESVTQGNESARREIARGSAADVRVQADALRQTLDVMRRLVPGTNEVTTLLEQVANAARAAGLEVNEFVPLPAVQGPEFDTVRYTFGLTGPYHSITAFMVNVGNLSRIVTPVNVRLTVPSAQPPAAKSFVINAKMEVWTYVARATPLVVDSAGRPAGQ